MSQDSSTITLRPMCYSPQNSSDAGFWAGKPKLPKLLIDGANGSTTTTGDDGDNTGRGAFIKRPVSMASLKSRVSSQIPRAPSSRSGVESSGDSPRFSLDEITEMNQTLGDARQKGEMPDTTASPLDSGAVAEDYANLLRLREARSTINTENKNDSPGSAAAAYQRLRVEIARRIKERDDRSDRELQDQETQRRVQDYLYSAKKEQFFLSESGSSGGSSLGNSPLGSPPASPRFPPVPHRGANKLVEQLYDIVQQAGEYFDATEPFLDTLDHHDNSFSEHVRDMQQVYKHFCNTRDNLKDVHGDLKNVHDNLEDVHGNLDNVHGNLKSLHDNLEQVQGNLQDVQAQAHETHQYQQYIQQCFFQSLTSQTHALNHHLNSAHALTSHLNSLMDPQAKAVQASTENLALLATMLTQLSEHVRIMPTIIQHTVQQTVQQTVNNAVQREVSVAMRQIMEAQQNAMLSLLERPQPQSQPRPQLQAKDPARCISRKSVFASKFRAFFRVQTCS